MAKKVSERVYVMKENFMAHHLEGESIPEIAARYNLSRKTVYAHLQEIADEAGVTRDSLLQILRSPTERQCGDEEVRVKVSVEDLEKGFDDVRNSFQSLIKLIDDVLEEETECKR